MFFLMFLVLSGIVWALGLAFVNPARHQICIYSAVVFLFVITGLILFTYLSWWAGIIPLQFGNGALMSYSVSFPDGYLRRGPLGISIILVGLVGIVSPAIAAWIVGRRHGRRASTSII